MDELGAGAGTLEGSTVEEEADELRLRKGDFEQTLEVSLNDTPADAHHFNILHSEVSVAKTNIIKILGYIQQSAYTAGQRFVWDMPRHLQ